MPNWCSNSITISGSTDTLEPLWEEANKEGSGLLQAMVPMPKELEGTTAPSEGDNWYGWRVNNWGTKWELCEYHGVDRKYLTLNSEGESTITFAFESAWSPPINALAHWLEKNEECQATLSYYEGGCDFMGIWDNFDDSVYNPSDYKSDDAFWDKGIGKQLDEDFAITESMTQWEEEQKEEESA